MDYKPALTPLPRSNARIGLSNDEGARRAREGRYPLPTQPFRLDGSTRWWVWTVEVDDFCARAIRRAG